MITCPFCGAQNTAGAAFCNTCGGALNAAAATQAQAAQAAARTAAQAAYATQAQTAAAQRPHPQFATGRLPPQSRLGKRYLVLKTIGQGGMAAVYLATDTKGKQRPVAIKEMSQDGLSAAELKESLASFNAEADILTGLNHPNLPKVYERFSEGARHYLVMEYIEGETLEQRQAGVKGAALPEAEVMSWAAQLCAVLAYLHSRSPKIIFRDLKPANVMVTRQGQVKLIDFGIARNFSPHRTRDTQALGTPGYAPPEQYGKAQTDERADIYALGCTLYQLLTGYEVARTPFALPPMHTRNPHISPHIQLAIERATRLDRNTRFTTVQEFASALLHPSGLYFRSGEMARSLRELMTLCQKYPQEAEEQLYTGRIEGWLRFWKEPAAASVAHAAVTSNPASQAAGLTVFMRDATKPATRTATGQTQTAQQTTSQQTTSQQTAQQRTIQQAIQQRAQQAAKQAAAAAAAAAAARVKASIQANVGAKTASKSPAGATATATAASAAAGTSTQTVVIVSPHAVNFGQLVAGQRGVFTITLRGQNGGSVAGKLTPLASWITLDSTQFSGTSTLVQVTAETSRISRPGIELATIQVSSGSQFLYIPVTVEVTSAPTTPTSFKVNGIKPTAASKGANGSANGGTNGARATASATRPAARSSASRASRRAFNGLSGLGLAAGSPHGVYGARFFSSLAVALLLSVGTMLAIPHYAGARLLGTGVAPQALAAGLLLLAALLGTLGAYFGAGRFAVRTRGRFLTTTIGAAAGLIISLSYGAHWLFSPNVNPNVSTVLIQGDMNAPRSLLFLLPILVSIGGAVGADRQYSAWMLAVIRFIARYAPFFVMAGLILAGGWTGFVLTNAFLYGWFIPLGVIFGVVFGAAVAGRINHGLRSLARLHP